MAGTGLNAVDTAATLQLDLFDGKAAQAGVAAQGSELSALARRQQGITLTPAWLVDLMLDRVALAGPFDTIVDPGAGSGHFCIAAARRFPGARVVAVEKSGVMLVALRQQLLAAGMADRVQVVQGDFRDVPWVVTGRCAYVGNPPFVRHHDIEPHWKQWYGQAMAGLGHKASQLAGLHLHFLARIGQRLRAGDFVCLVTSAEWLDNGYGSAWRALLSRDHAPMRLSALWVADSAAQVFPEALVSAVVLEAGAHADGAPVTLGLLGERGLSPSRVCPAAALAASARWSGLCQHDLLVPAVGVELGDLFRITRGQVTGLNKAWILSPEATDLPHSLTLPMVTRAKEIIDGTVQAADALQRLKRVPCLPVDLATVPAAMQLQVQRFLARARALGAADGYVARQRPAWHALDLREPPAAMVSYMGRRPPVFCSNPHRASMLNIAHGLYPRQPVASATLAALLEHLNHNTDMRAGRMYGGGMAKFEPSDVARLRIPAHVLAPVP